MIETAQWIATPPEAVSPVISRRFTLRRPTAGRIEVTGLGYFVLRVNGKRAGDAVHTPALTDYFPRNVREWNYPLTDTFSHRILYLTYDLTPYLADGENLLELWLGNGWLRQHERVCEGEMTYSESLLACYALSLTDGEGERLLRSDGSETYTDSPVTYSNLYIGEVIDARLAGRAQPPRPVRIVPAPETRLEPQTCPPDRVIRTISPAFLHQTEDGRRIYDVGENITGRVVVTAAGRPGEELVLRFSEELTPEGEPDFLSTGANNRRANGEPQIQCDRFVCGGERTVFRPEFVWHAFRYFEISGEAEELLVEVIHTEVSVTSSFTCSDPTLNWLYDAYLRTQLDNYHGCIPSDCPHRERLGYTGDGQITARAAMLTMDARGVYEKWIRDILDCQDTAGGHVQHTAPPMGGGGGPGVWGGAVVIVPHEFYLHYGDREMLSRSYGAMQKWLSYLERRSENDIVMREEEHGWSLGDWATLVMPPKIPSPFVNTCCLSEMLGRVAHIARVLGREEDARACEEKAARVRTAILRDFYDPATGSFCEGEQAADAFALWAGVEPDGRVLENLVRKYRELGYFDTGFVGTERIIDVLTARGEADLAIELMTSGRVGSYEFTRASGATTLWEYFDGRRSRNHPMFGAPVRHLFDRLLGIGQEPDSAGYRSLRIEPVVPTVLASAEGTVSLPCGQVSVGWERREKELLLRVAVPAGVPARLIFAGRETVLAPGKNELRFPER